MTVSASAHAILDEARIPAGDLDNRLRALKVQRDGARRLNAALFDRSLRSEARALAAEEKLADARKQVDDLREKLLLARDQDVPRFIRRGPTEIRGRAA